MKEIGIYEVGPVGIGQAEDKAAGTGCTVLLLGDGAPAGLDIRGGGPASRESQLLSPLASAGFIHAILLSGGSAFGLCAASGVQRYLEERGVGLPVGPTRVPLVAQACLFDLTVGDPYRRPDAEMAYQACLNAEKRNYRDGNYGAGAGATVGKLLGMEHCMKAGIGSYAVELGELRVGALVAVNALGDIYDRRNGRKVAGICDPHTGKLMDTLEVMTRSYRAVENRFVSNTTLGIVITNARFDKTALCKIAGMTHNGYARSILPVHTSADGDSIYAVSVGNVDGDRDVVGALAAEVMSEAILRAVNSAESAYGFPCAAEVRGRGE